MEWIKRIQKRIKSFFSSGSNTRDEVERKYFENDKFIPFALELLKENPSKPLTITARGWSMRPFIEHDRDVLYFSLCDDVKVRDVVLAEIEKGHFVCHRIEKIDGENVTLRGDGNVNGTESCTLSDIRCKLIAVERLSKRWNLETSRFWHYYSIIWPKLLPVRRWLLAFNKVFILHQMPSRFKKDKK